MKEVYRIIHDLEALVTFIDWLPDLEKNECFYLTLQARKKYVSSLTHQIQLKRIACKKEMLIPHIKQFECPVGSYRTKHGEIITEEALVLYINTNPRDLHKATFIAARAMIDLIQKYEGDPSFSLKPDSEVLTSIHQAKGKTKWVHFDLDCEKDQTDVFDKIAAIVGSEAITIIETRGGYHLLVDPAKVVSDTKNWYGSITKSVKVDQAGDLMTPVVGCIQGGFVPRFVHPFPGVIHEQSNRSNAEVCD